MILRCVELGGLEELGGIGVAHEELIGSGALGVFDQAEAGGGVGLGVAIDEEGWDAAGGEAGGEVDAGGGLSDSALLVGDGNDPRHSGSGSRGGSAAAIVDKVEGNGWEGAGQWGKGCGGLWDSVDKCEKLCRTAGWVG